MADEVERGKIRKGATPLLLEGATWKAREGVRAASSRKDLPPSGTRDPSPKTTRH